MNANPINDQIDDFLKLSNTKSIEIQRLYDEMMSVQSSILTIVTSSGDLKEFMSNINKLSSRHESLLLRLYEIYSEGTDTANLVVISGLQLMSNVRQTMESNEEVNIDIDKAKEVTKRLKAFDELFKTFSKSRTETQTKLKNMNEENAEAIAEYRAYKKFIDESKIMLEGLVKDAEDIVNSMDSYVVDGVPFDSFKDKFMYDLKMIQNLGDQSAYSIVDEVNTKFDILESNMNKRNDIDPRLKGEVRMRTLLMKQDVGTVWQRFSELDSKAVHKVIEWNSRNSKLLKK